MQTPDEVIAAALALSDEDRIEILEAIVRSFGPVDQTPLDESWRPVIERRSAELTAGSVASVPWSEVRRQAREAAGG